jgi:tRNA (guanine-N7-)-methyltransferase
MRLRRKPWIDKALTEVLESYLYMEGLERFRGQWQQRFPGKEICLEIGCGKGRFITGMAALHPEKAFIGIETARDVAFFAARKAKEAALTNVCILCANAEQVEEWFAPGEVARLYLNFSDPWPKARHAKRRLTHHNFLARYEKLLAPSGTLRFKTDNRALFDFSLEEFREYGMEVRTVSYDLHHSNLENEVQTEYEERFSAAGAPINFCEASFKQRQKA